MDAPKTESGWSLIGMTVDETAQALRIDRKTVFLMIKERGLPARRVGRGWRIDPEALRQWIATRDDQPAEAGDDGEGSCV